MSHETPTQPKLASLLARLLNERAERNLKDWRRLMAHPTPDRRK